MPNYCDFDIHVKGKKKDILTLFDWMNADYRYCGSEFDSTLGKFPALAVPECFVIKNGTRIEVPHHVGYRIFEVNFCEEDIESLDDSDDLCIYAWGYCAWSVYSCMFEGPHTYYSDDKDYPISLSITLPNACKELHLETEIYSSEPGMSFAEHYHISADGEILKDECIPFYDIYIEEYGNYEEYVKYCKDELEEEPIITKAQFDKARREGECSIAICNWLSEENTWPFTLY